MIFPTYTKINIGLFVTEKRSDDFHNIESVFYPVNFGDVLEIIPVEGKGEISFETFGIKIPGDSKRNLCVKAYQILNADFNLQSVRSSLLKNVPIGAGLGGGSSDGVEMLKGLNKLFKLNVSDKKLKEYALELGSDCPFFVDNQPKFVSGRGEVLEDIVLDLSNKYIVLVFPDFHVSSPEAYKLISPRKPIFDLRTIDSLSINNWENEVANDFESPIANSFPEINTIKNKLKNFSASYTSMSGSGSTVYGIFDSKPQNLDFTYRYWSGKL